MPKTSPFNQWQYDSNIAALPELSYACHIVTGEAIVIVRAEPGFRPVDTDKFPFAAIDPKAFVREQNEAMQVTPAQGKAMLMGSIFGWDKPGAHPDSMLAKAD